MPFFAAVTALLQEHVPAAAEGTSKGPFAINPGLTIWTLVVFGILMFILAKTAWPAILKQIEEREARIRQQLEDASKANTEEMVAKGREEQEELLARARREIALERDRAVAELRKEAVELSIAAATKVIGRNLDTEADRKMVQDYLASLRNTAS